MHKFLETCNLSKLNQEKADSLLRLTTASEIEQTLLQGGHTEGPEMYERMLNSTSHQKYAN